jgi:GxxExxY protein
MRVPGEGLRECPGNAIARSGIGVAQQSQVVVRYKQGIVGRYYADLLIDDRLIVEIKASRAIDDRHEAQCINYLRAARLPLCLLLNFSRPRLEIHRIARSGMATDEHR